MDSFSTETVMSNVKLAIKEKTKEVHCRHIVRENAEIRKLLKSLIISINEFNFLFFYCFLYYFLVFYD